MSAHGVLDPRGMRALVYSLGIEGRDLARWLLAHGASVVMSDTRTPEALAAARAEPPEGVERVVSGQPLLDAAGFDLLAVSQSILRHDPAMVRARELGIPVISQMQLFLDLCPGRIVAITGSSGKSTTTSLVGAMAAAAGVDHVVGGNLGPALLGEVERIGPGTLVIVEVSHTQLQYTRRAPDVGAITNITPNHLDQFTWEEYIGLKRHLLEDQSPDAIGIRNADNQVSMDLQGLPGIQRLTSMRGPTGSDGAWLAAGQIVCRSGGNERAVAMRSAIRLRGEHNVANAVMACAVADAAGLPDAAMAAAIETFAGVPHRLEIVGTVNGVTWVNDSIATAAERTIAGLRTFDEPVVLLLGGKEKNVPVDGLQAEAAKRCRAVVCFGADGEFFADAMRGQVPSTVLVEGLDEAVEAAARVARPGDVVLFSPAGTSFDAYPHFEARGEAFRALVRGLPGFREVSR
jgi:UDP-N-acetylmuramoylalanine--D-glutamate ligase